MRLFPFWLWLGAAIVSACDSPPAERQVTDIEAMDIAGLYVEKHHPESLEQPLRPVPHDRGYSWIITYETQEGAAGPVPPIEVDKSTGCVSTARSDEAR